MTTTYVFYPLADEFPLMTGPAFDELVADIKTNGQQKPIIMFQNLIIDGRNRYLACVKLGIEPLRAPFPIMETYEHARAYVISANIHRRHLDPDAKRKIIEALLRADPSQSDRSIADKAGTADHKKVNRARKRMVATGALATVDRLVGRDGKTRALPAKKPTERPPEETQAEASAEERKQEAVAEEAAWDDADVASHVRLLHMLLKRNGAEAVARELRRGSVPRVKVSELAKWLRALDAAMAKSAPAQIAADRGEARAKNTAAPANGLDHLDIPNELRRRT